MMGDKLETYALQKWQTPEKASQFAFEWFHQKYSTQGRIYLPWRWKRDIQKWVAFTEKI